MSETFEQAVNEVYEEQKEEKIGFFKNAKEAIAGKVANFEDDHPTASKVVKTTGKVAVGVLVFVGGLLLGNAVAHRDSEDYPGFDDFDITSEVETE